MKIESRRSAFTLVELLVTMGLMAMLATISIGGYYAAVRGMTERGARQDVISFLRLAQQRALVDQVPTAVFLFNRKLLEANPDTGESERIVGMAVAVRTVGRLSYVDGNFLGDEFGDLDKTFPTNGAVQASNNSRSSMRLYRMVRLGSADAGYSTVYSFVKRRQLNTEEVFGARYTTNTNYVWGFEKMGGSGSATWHVGDPYGSEIATLQLPHGYIFGNTIPTQMGDTRSVGSPFFFNPEQLSDLAYRGSSFNMSTIDIRAYRPGKGGFESVESVKASDLNDDSN